MDLGRCWRGSLQLNGVLDGFGDGWRFEFFFDIRVICFEGPSKMICDSDYKREYAFEE